MKSVFQVFLVFSQPYTCESIELYFKKFVESHQVNLFLAGLGHLEPLYSRTVCTVICTVQCTPHSGFPVVHWQCTELLPILCTSVHCANLYSSVGRSQYRKNTELVKRCGPSLYVSRKSNVKKRASGCRTAPKNSMHTERKMSNQSNLDVTLMLQDDSCH